ncbi:putative exclusion protein ren of cryptic prophage [Escherichia coli M056]|uniref:DUF977 family protein n=1 Tax=Escherichia coli TaxID=562 RepID=UPI000A18362E|nr:DUF977 family protein [Escherichia coli]OSK25440.1 putative exclusion protein ren of cryptic prophage [Escherichia coli M056]
MAAIYTQEQREELKMRIVELVYKNGYMTMLQLVEVTHVSRESVRRYLKELSNQERVYYKPSLGAFPTEHAFCEWQNQTGWRERVLVKKGSQLNEAEVRAYDRHQNIICSECRNSEAMQRVLAFYRDGFQEATCEQMVQG